MKRSRRYNDILLERRLKFREEFCDELDISDMGIECPEWVYEYRAPLLDKISKPLKQLARLLKDCGIRFKMKCPLGVEGRWRFADIYVPDKDMVIMITSRKDSIAPSLFMDEKTEFFSRSHNACQLDYDVFDGEHNKVIELISNLN